MMTPITICSRTIERLLIWQLSGHIMMISWVTLLEGVDLANIEANTCTIQTDIVTG